MDDRANSAIASQIFLRIGGEGSDCTATRSCARHDCNTAESICSERSVCSIWRKTRRSSTGAIVRTWGNKKFVPFVSRALTKTVSFFAPPAPPPPLSRLFFFHLSLSFFPPSLFPFSSSLLPPSLPLSFLSLNCSFSPHNNTNLFTGTLCSHGRHKMRDLNCCSQVIKLTLGKTKHMFAKNQRKNPQTN